MRKELRHWLQKKNPLFFLLPFLLAVIPSVCPGQTVLEQADLVIVSISSGSVVDFEFVPFTDLEEGTVIHFTDNAYTTATGSLTQTGSTLTYTVQEPVVAGSVISYKGNGQNFEGPEPGPDDWGNNLLVYQATGSDTTFIYGAEWGNNTPSWTYETTAAGFYSDVPPGLSKETHTVISLGEELYHWYDDANGTEGSPEALLGRVGNAEYWRSGEARPIEYNISFSVLHTPTLGLSVADSVVSAAGGKIRVAVELAELSRAPVSAQVIFLKDSSTVSQADIGYFTSQLVRFSASDDEGSPKFITIPISDSVSFTGSRTAVFGLQGDTGGSVTTPQTVKVEIKAGDEREPDAPDLSIAEVNLDPHDDADGNGVVDKSDDEFVEFVNNSDTAIDISGWTFSDDGSTTRHIFPAGTVIPASGALVLFANEEVIPAGSFGGAVVQNSNQSKTLHLDDQGDLPTLKDARGNVVVRHPYGTGVVNSQWTGNVSPTDPHAGKHPGAAGRERPPSTPGGQSDGSSYGLKHRMGIREEGWRVIASPEPKVSFKEFLEGFRIQGIGGSEAPAEEATIYYWDEISGGTLTKPASVTDMMESGRGYIIYFTENENNRTGAEGSRYDIPAAVTVDKTTDSHPVSVTVSATDANENGVIDQNEGYNLLGNPFGTNISVTAVLDALERVGNSLNRNVLIWNPAGGNGNGVYQSLTDGDIIAPFQAFFVRFMDEVSGNAVLNYADLLPRKEKRPGNEDREEPFGYTVTLSDGNVYDRYQLIFKEDGDTGRDKLDVYKLLSLNPGSLNLFSREGDVRLMKNILPADLNTALEIPLLFEPSEGKETFEFSWQDIGRLPEDWGVRLVDRELDREIDLNNSTGYDFSVVMKETVPHRPAENRKNLINQPQTEEDEPRFALLVHPGTGLLSNRGELPEAAKLNPNYPNPFSSVTRIPFELTEEAEVELSIWNIVGQKVATLIDEVRKAGPDEVAWNAADLPSGIYIAQMEVGGSVYIRKMTLIKH